MSTTAVIISVLAGGLFILISIAVTLQSIEKSRKERRLLETALNARARNFQHLLDGFPQGFLSRDLQVLVCKCLADAYEQLAYLDGKNPSYRKQRDLNAERLKQFQEKAPSQPNISLGSIVQIREVQKLLTSLHKFIAKLLESGQITAPEGKTYSLQIRRLILLTTVDALKLQTSEAIADGKPRLAVHHVQTAIEKLSRENSGGQYTSQISAFKDQLAQLEQQAQQIEAETQARREEADKEWDELNKPDESWKKKALYD